MIKELELLAYLYIYTKYPQINFLINVSWDYIKPFIQDNKIYVSVTEKDLTTYKLQFSRFQVVTIEDSLYLEIEVDKEILDKYTSKKYSEMFSASDLEKWKEYNISCERKDKRYTLIYLILTKHEKLKDRIERRLNLIRGILDTIELYEVTAYYFDNGARCDLFY